VTGAGVLATTVEVGAVTGVGVAATGVGVVAAGGAGVVDAAGAGVFECVGWAAARWRAPVEGRGVPAACRAVVRRRPARLVDVRAPVRRAEVEALKMRAATNVGALRLVARPRPRR
jgi:hypothetical protein